MVPLKLILPPLPTVRPLTVLCIVPAPVILPVTSAVFPEARLIVPAALILFTKILLLKFLVVPLVTANVPSLLKLLAITGVTV